MLSNEGGEHLAHARIQAIARCLFEPVGELQLVDAPLRRRALRSLVARVQRRRQRQQVHEGSALASACQADERRHLVVRLATQLAHDAGEEARVAIRPWRWQPVAEVLAQ